jgi:hypothetical protein
MKTIVSFVLLMLHLPSMSAQGKLRFGLSSNLAKTAYNTAELAFMTAAKEGRWIAQAGLMYTNGKIYGSGKAEIDPAFMVDKPCGVLGGGADLQFKYNISNGIDPEVVLYLAVGASYNRYKVSFYENMYVRDPSTGMYHYQVANLKSSFSQSSCYGQLILSRNIYRRFIVELGAGAAINDPKTSIFLDTYRDFNKDVWAYGVKGVSPVFTCRLGYWLYWKD